MYMLKKQYTKKKNKSKGGTKKKGKQTYEVCRTQKEKNEGFMKVFHKTYDKLKSYSKEESGSKRKLDDIDDIDILTAMNTANNATLKGGKKYKKKRQTRKNKKTRRKYKI